MVEVSIYQGACKRWGSFENAVATIRERARGFQVDVPYYNVHQDTDALFMVVTYRNLEGLRGFQRTVLDHKGTD